MGVVEVKVAVADDIEEFEAVVSGVDELDGSATISTV